MGKVKKTKKLKIRRDKKEEENKEFYIVIWRLWMFDSVHWFLVGQMIVGQIIVGQMIVGQIIVG